MIERYDFRFFPEAFPLLLLYYFDQIVVTNSFQAGTIQDEAHIYSVKPARKVRRQNIVLRTKSHFLEPEPRILKEIARMIASAA